MSEMTFSEAVSRSQRIREIYHRLEMAHHGSEWTTEEDALAFLTDAGIVGRLTMARLGRWPAENAHGLEHKLGECIWWLIAPAGRMDIDAEDALESFLSKTEQQLEKSHPSPSPQRDANRIGPDQAERPSPT